MEEPAKHKQNIFESGFTISTALFLMLLFLSCKKLQLTRKTEKGANTFSCIIDGKVFKECTSWFGGPSLNADVYYSNGKRKASIYAKCTDEIQPHQSVSFKIGDFHGKGTYLISDSNNFCHYEEWDIPSRTFVSTSNSSGKVTITENGRVDGHDILAGTFEATLVNKNNTSEKISIKYGRFDIQIN